MNQGGLMTQVGLVIWVFFFIIFLFALFDYTWMLVVLMSAVRCRSLPVSPKQLYDYDRSCDLGRSCNKQAMSYEQDRTYDLGKSCSLGRSWLGHLL